MNKNQDNMNDKNQVNRNDKNTKNLNNQNKEENSSMNKKNQDSENTKKTKTTKSTKNTKSNVSSKSTKGGKAAEGSKTASTEKARSAKKTKGKSAGPAVHPKLNAQTEEKVGFTMSQDIDGAAGEYTRLWSTEISLESEFLDLPSSLSVGEVLGNFDARLVEPIKVSERDGAYNLIDGAKTFMMLRELYHQKGIEEFEVMCRVYHGLQEEDEARVYATIDDLHEKLSMANRIRALLVAKDEEMLDFKKVTLESGFSIRPGDYKTHDGKICAICAAFYAYRKLGAKEYLRMLKILMRTWAGASWSVTKNMLNGMTIFMQENRVSMNSFAAKFEHISYEDILAKAAEYPGRHRGGAFADALKELYTGVRVSDEYEEYAAAV